MPTISAAPVIVPWCRRRTPISGTRSVRSRPTLSRQRSFAQPKGASLPPRSRIASLRFGSATIMPPGSPSTSAMATYSSRRSA
jgi:hypothetical protein